MNMTNITYADEEEVVGLCGLHKSYETIEEKKGESKRKMYPWWAYISIKVNISVFNFT